MLHFLGDLLSIVFTLITAFCLIHAFSTYLVYWMESRLAYWQDASNTMPSFLLVARNALIEFLCNFTRFLLLPFSGFFANPSSVNALSESQGSPILLVHGYAQNQSDWFWVQYQLKQWGMGPVYTVNLWNPFSGIEVHAETLAQKIQFLKNKHPHQAITLIGHSMGGLVASYYAENMADDRIKKIITLGTPFYGTRIAGLGAGLNAEQMAPNSDFLDSLREKIQNSSIPYYHLASQMDNMIVPWDSALMNPIASDNEHVIPDQGHVRLLVSPEVLDKVKEWLEK